jgi:hypothetical protein
MDYPLHGVGRDLIDRASLVRFLRHRAILHMPRDEGSSTIIERFAAREVADTLLALSEEVARIELTPTETYVEKRPPVSIATPPEQRASQSRPARRGPAGPGATEDC